MACRLSAGNSLMAQKNEVPDCLTTRFTCAAGDVFSRTGSAGLVID